MSEQRKRGEARMPKTIIREWETRERLDQLRTMSAAGMRDKDIAHHIGITPITFSGWLRRSQKIREAVCSGNADKMRARAVHGKYKGLAFKLDEIEERINAWKIDRAQKNLPLTITSLICFLGIDKSTLYRLAEDNTETGTDINIDGIEYRKKVKDAIKKAYRECENSLVDRCLGRGQCAGAIFILKNHYHYTDVQKIETDSGPVIVKWGTDVPKALKVQTAEKPVYDIQIK